jgi:hypothetical protein
MVQNLNQEKVLMRTLSKLFLLNFVILETMIKVGFDTWTDTVVVDLKKYEEMKKNSRDSISEIGFKFSKK